MSRTLSASFPSVMRDQLRAVRTRKAVFASVRALLVALTVFVLAMLTAMLIDWGVTLFETRVRVLLSATSLLAGWATLLFMGWTPIRRAFGWTTAAEQVDQQIPQLEERWQTVANMSKSGRQPTAPATQAMLERVTQEAVAMSRLVRPERVVNGQPLRRPMLGLGAVLVALGVFFVSHWGQTSILWQRFWSPTQNISATQFAVRTGDVIVPRGSSLDVVAEMQGLQRESVQLILRRESAPGVDERLAVSALNGTVRFPVDVDETVRYRIQAGDGRTEWYTLTAIDFPELQDVRLTVTPPKYVDEPATEKNLIPSRLRAVQGSQLELAIKPQIDLKLLQLQIAMPVAAALSKTTEPVAETEASVTERIELLTLKRGNDGWYRFETALVESFTLTPLLVSSHDLTNKNPRVCRVEVIEDHAPIARIVSPSGEGSASLNDKLEIRFEAHDDHGIATAELVIYSEPKDGETAQVLAVREIPLGDQAMQKRVMGKIELDLKELRLQAGTNISYSVRVTDNRDLEVETGDPLDRMLAALDPQDQMPTEAAPQDSDVAGKPSANPRESVETSEPSASKAQPGDGNSEESPQGDQDSAKAETDAAEADRMIAESENSAPPTGPKSNTDSTRSPPETSPKEAGPAPSDQSVADRQDDSPNPSGRPQSRNSSKPKPADEHPAEATPKDQVPPGSPSTQPPPKVKAKLDPQLADSGQQRETDRRQLRIVSTLEAVATSDDPRRDKTKSIRDQVVKIDQMLEVIEGQLTALYRHQVEDARRGPGFRTLDTLLHEVEQFVTGLETDSRETVFEFVGLQMIDISRTHVTPARDAVFMAIRTPDAGADVPTEEALHHVLSARELLQALLKRYDSVAQEQQLAEKLSDAVKMYTIYVERSQRLMREAQQNLDPLQLQREMQVVELDQTYLDRLAEVTRMRRDMMSELARILSDDPRLSSRYLDLIKRRRSSLANQLAELAARQDQTALEVTGWIQVEENQRANYWQQISDLRLDAPKNLAKEAHQLADRVEKQLPLVLDPAVGAAAVAISTAQQIALAVRRCDLAVGELRQSSDPTVAGSALSGSAASLADQVGELSAALDRLQFENESLEGVLDYVERRRIEVRAFADQADAWSVTARAIERVKYSELAGHDQLQIAIATELLRTEMLTIDSDLAGQFNAEVPLPQEVINLTQDLQRVMESITHNQNSATFGFTEDRVSDASAQQELALQGFENAQKLLSQLRRKTAEALDKIKPRDPNIADLRDPTLDQFLADLEREPNIEAQLGIPNRPRNIRFMQDEMTWQKTGGQLLGTSSNGAMARIQAMMKQSPMPNEGEDPKSQRLAQQEKENQKSSSPMTDEEKQLLADSAEMQKMLKERMEQAQAELERQAQDPSKSEEQRKQLADMAAQMARSVQEMERGQSPEQLWQQMVQADQAKATLEALAKGEQIPDEQWNKLMSTLGDGQGQVTGRVPSEDYRKSIEQYQERIRQLTGSR